MKEEKGIVIPRTDWLSWAPWTGIIALGLFVIGINTIDMNSTDPADKDAAGGLAFLVFFGIPALIISYWSIERNIRNMLVKKYYDKYGLAKTLDKYKIIKKDLFNYYLERIE